MAQTGVGGKLAGNELCLRVLKSDPGAANDKLRWEVSCAGYSAGHDGQQPQSAARSPPEMLTRLAVLAVRRATERLPAATRGNSPSGPQSIG